MDAPYQVRKLTLLGIISLAVLGILYSCNTFFNYKLLNSGSIGLFSLVYIALYLGGLFSVLLALLTAFRNHIIFPKGINGLIAYFMATLSLWTLSAFLSSKYLFCDSLLTSVVSNCMVMKQDLLSMFSNLLFLSFMFLGMISSRSVVIYSSWPKILQFALGTLFSSLIFFDILCKIEGFLGSGGIVINIDQVLRLRPQDLLFILALILYCFLAFYIPIQFYKTTSTSLSTGKKTFTMALSITVAAMIFMFTGHTLNMIPVVLFLMVYFLTLDIYVDYIEKNVSFILWWILMFSGFLAFSMYTVSINHELATRRTAISTAFNKITQKTANAVITCSDTLINSGIVEQLSLLSYPAPLDYHDIYKYVESHLEKIIPPRYSLGAVHCFDDDGGSLYLNHASVYDFSKIKLNESIKLNNNIFYSRLDDEFNLYYQIDNPSFPHNPIHLIIELNSSHEKFGDSNPELNYVIYKDDRIVRSHISESDNANDFSPQTINNDQIIDGISYLVYHSDEYRIVSFRKVGGLIKPISLFSLCFSLTGFITIILALINTRFRFLPEDLNLRLYKKSALRTKIQTAIILLILFSFLTIGLTTAFYYNKLFVVNNQKNFRSELTTLINDIDTRIKEYPSEAGITTAISKYFDQLNKVHGKKMAYYDVNGILVVKSPSYKLALDSIPPQELSLVSKIYSKDGIKTLSKVMSNSQILVPIYSGSMEAKAYITLEDESLKIKNNGLYEFLSTLLNVYIFLFLLAGALSIAIANSITLPLARLAESVKKFKLGKDNEPLHWDTNDEIGMLIKNYNNLTTEVVNSADLLAKTQRDMAWREMAKQVAHEIKNPLTPMKLSIQYLDKVVKNDPVNATSMIEKISATLIEQIDNLTQIADEFSNFATLPKATNERIILNEVVEHIHDLFRKRDDMDIEMVEPINEIYVFADRNHLIRILNNIVKNAIQAIPEDRRGNIIIELQKFEDHARIKVSDNGVGIPSSMKDKVFTPNFTTKNSGTGLGLAISANMMETMNGRLYFESEPDKGTDFYMELPLMRLDVPEEGQVYLDE